MLKKVLKIIGIIAGVYAVSNTLCLAVIGIGRIIRYSLEPHKDCRDIALRAWDEAMYEFKRYGRLLKCIFG